MPNEPPQSPVLVLRAGCAQPPDAVDIGVDGQFFLEKGNEPHEDPGQPLFGNLDFPVHLDLPRMTAHEPARGFPGKVHGDRGSRHPGDFRVELRVEQAGSRHGDGATTEAFQQGLGAAPDRPGRRIRAQEEERIVKARQQPGIGQIDPIECGENRGKRLRAGRQAHSPFQLADPPFDRRIPHGITPRGSSPGREARCRARERSRHGNRCRAANVRVEACRGACASARRSTFTRRRDVATGRP